MPEIRLTDKDDTYTLAKNSPWSEIMALAGNDTITLLSGSNVVGGAGNDTIIDQTGSSYCAAAYWDAPDAIDANLQTGVVKDGWGSIDTLVNIHNIQTSGRNGDRVTGSTQDDQTWINGFWTPGEAWINLGAGSDKVTVKGTLADFQMTLSADGRNLTLSRNGYIAHIQNVEALEFWTESVTQRYAVADLIDYSKVGVTTLIQSAANAWSNGAGVSLSYSFMTAVPLYGGGEGGSGFTVPSAAYQSAVRTILSQLTQETGLVFSEMADGDASQMRFASNQQTTTKGYSFTAAAANGQKAGDVWMDLDSVASPTPGSEGWQALLHEIGHALGLTHPVPESDTASGVVLLNRWNSNAYTVMSENQSASGLWQSWYGPLDLQALRSLYGTGTGAAHAGADTYSLTDTTGGRLSTISDAGGHDVLDASGLSRGVYLDLTPGSFSSAGLATSGSTSLGNLFIDAATVIEDAIGTAYDDVLTGNSADNIFSPGTGNDMVNGAGGFNIVRMSAARSAYSLGLDAATGHVLMSAVDGASGADELQNIQRIAFSDCAVALDMDGKGSTVAKILGAVFGKESITNREYAGIGMGLMDQGYTPVTLMDLALRTKLGAGFDATSEVNLFFGTLVGRAPSSDEQGYYTGLVSSGQFTLNSLAWMAANTSLNTDNIGLTGLMQTGLDYVPLGSSLV